MFTTRQTAIKTRSSFSREYHLFKRIMGYVEMVDCHENSCRNKTASGIFFIMNISLVTGANTIGSANYSILELYGSIKR